MSTAMLDTACPYCGLDPLREKGHVPSEGTVWTCRCGFIGIWDLALWRSPRKDEMAEILDVGSVVERSLLAIQANLMFDRDADLAQKIIYTEMYRALQPDDDGQCAALETIAKRAAAALRAEQFHTHTPPLDMEWPDDEPEY